MCKSGTGPATLGEPSSVCGCGLQLGEPAFLAFDDGEPNVEKHCLTLHDTGMHTHNCDNSDDYLCEFDAVPAVSTAF
jgi:hypothetical protein